MVIHQPGNTARACHNHIIHQSLVTSRCMSSTQGQLETHRFSAVKRASAGAILLIDHPGHLVLTGKMCCGLNRHSGATMIVASRHGYTSRQLLSPYCPSSHNLPQLGVSSQHGEHHKIGYIFNCAAFFSTRPSAHRHGWHPADLEPRRGVKRGVLGHTNLGCTVIVARGQLPLSRGNGDIRCLSVHGKRCDLILY